MFDEKTTPAEQLIKWKNEKKKRKKNNEIMQPTIKVIPTKIAVIA
jgi:hypothetical protein